jgi:transposase
LEARTNGEICMSLNKACGVDVHTRFLAVTILDRGGGRWYREFDTSVDGLLEFKAWVLSSGCERVAFESTGVYWTPVYNVLEGFVEVYLANAYHIKHINGKKTDQSDSDWIAQLCLNDLIKPSRVFPVWERSLRTLTRLRASLVEDKTRCKNRVHKALQSCHVKLSSALTDIFGKTGKKVLEGLLAGISGEEVLQGLPKRLRGKEDLLREALRNSLDPANMLVVRENLELFELLEDEIRRVEEEIRGMLVSKKSMMDSLLSIPGISFVSASTILGELGDPMDFENGDRLACWAGLTPSVYQSADKLITGHITKQGSRRLRWIMTEVAQAAAKAKNTRLSRFFRRIKGKKGYKIAVIALARKMLCIIHHLLKNNEIYIEEDYRKKTVRVKTPQHTQITVEEIIQTLKEANYIVYKKKPNRGCT